ncbi:MAG TPA: ABC transporter permease [bacterium]|nr:ABC transporter permease [bacterium]
MIARRTTALLSLPVLLAVAGLAVLPLVMIVIWSFWRWDPSIYWMRPAFALDAYGSVFGTDRFVVMVRTVRLAVVTAALALFLGYPVALFMERFAASRQRNVLMLLFLVPFFTSYVVRTFAWRLILGRTGLLNTLLIRLGVLSDPLEWLLFSEFSVQVGLLASYLPFMIFPLLLSFGRIDRSFIEASEDLGASFSQTFRHVILPLSAPGVFAGFLFVFVMALGSSVEVQFLGGAAQSMIAIMIQDVMRVLNFPLAFAISTSVIVLLVALLILGSRILGLDRLFSSMAR